MRKLKLDLDDLMVEAFETANTPTGEGTVEAYGPTFSGPCDTCYVSCNLTACPLDCSNGFHSECCSGDTCPPTYDYTCGDACSGAGSTGCC